MGVGACDALAAHTGVSVRLWDERLTAVGTARVLRSSGIEIEMDRPACSRIPGLQSRRSIPGATAGKSRETCSAGVVRFKWSFREHIRRSSGATHPRCRNIMVPLVEGTFFALKMDT
jgi:hypothetical protein